MLNIKNDTKVLTRMHEWNDNEIMILTFILNPITGKKIMAKITIPEWMTIPPFPWTCD